MNERAIRVHVPESDARVEQEFEFDHCFSSEIGNNGQVHISQHLGSKIVKDCASGFNSTLFAYGQTSSGKSHTITGNLQRDEEMGLLPRFCKGILSNIGNRQDLHLEVSFMEIYDEKVYDLLEDFQKSKDQREPLRVREHPTMGCFVENIRKVRVSSLDQILQLLIDANERRTSAETSMNSASSRSHAIFSFSLIDSRLDGFVGSKVNFVDLAGSERQSKSKCNENRLKESSFINKSLTVLGRIIRDLSEKGESFSFRESTLTRLLKSSLAGNTRTYMLATISPLLSDVKETVSTLTYASKAQKIVNRVSKNQERNKNAIEHLRHENSELILKMRAMENNIKSGFDVDSIEKEMELLVETYESQLRKIEIENQLLLKKLRDSEACIAQLSKDLFELEVSYEAFTNVSEAKRKVPMS